MSYLNNPSVPPTEKADPKISLPQGLNYAELLEGYSPDMYAVDETRYSLLNMGDWGSGKTHLCTTARKPILFYMFDPNGMGVIRSVAMDALRKGEIIVLPFWDENPFDPTQYLKWEAIWEKHLETKFLDNFGTVVLDTFSTWMDCAAAAVAKERGAARQGKKFELAIGDYPYLYNLTKKMIKMTASANCDFIMNAHLEPEQNEKTGVLRYKILTYNKLKEIVPPLFAEKWVTIKKPGSPRSTYHVLTDNDGLYEASTQMGAHKFAKYEEPNICKMLAKAGFDTSPKSMDFLKPFIQGEGEKDGK